MKLVLSFFLLLITFPNSYAYSFQEQQPYSVIPDQAKIKILSPTLAQRQTQKIRLANGLEAYLISDPTVEESGAVLSVKVGSWQEPEDYPGLAHFLEHMLFLGTKKYPKESEFDRFITEHGGTTNAFTSNDYTTFLFDVANSAFEESLDRFAYFFKEPLFNPSGVSRELNAIDQEFAKNIEDDDIRQIYVFKELGDEKHPNFRFNMGNSKTLQKVSRDNLINWYIDHYSANLMRLVVLSNQPIDKIRQMVVEDFSGIPNKNGEPYKSNQKVMSKDVSGKIVYIAPVKNIHTLSISWEIPLKLALMRDSKPESLICQVLGHEGKESLLAQLKHENLAETLMCSGTRLGGDNYVLYVDIDLTNEGIKKVDTVIERLFQTIAMFKREGVPKYLFDEIQRMATIQYQYQSAEDTFKTMLHHASPIVEEDISTYPEQSKIIQRFDPEAASELLAYLTPENAFITLAAPPSLTGVKPDRKEKWMDISYAIKPIPAEKMKEWSSAQPNPNINLPPANPFIPGNLSMVTTQVFDNRIVPRPKAILNTDNGLVYYSSDSHFNVPEIYWEFQIKTPQVESGVAAKEVLADMYVDILKATLNAYSYPATVAGLSYEIDRKDFGISLKINGYSDKAPLLFAHIINKLKNIDLTEESFKTHKDILARKYQNSDFDTPINQGAEILKTAIYKKYAPPKAKANAIKKITFESFDEYYKNLFKKVYVEGTLYGNMTEDDAKSMTSQLLYNLNGAPYPKKDHKMNQVIDLPDNKGPFYIEQTIKSQGNAVLLAISNGHYTFKNRAVQQIFSDAISEPFFAELRTRQQTGYLVYNDTEELERHLFLLFFVQSNSHNVRDLLARFELFIERYVQEMSKGEFPAERFENIKQALTANLQNPAKNLKEMGELLNLFAFKYDGDFDWIDKRIEGLNSLSYEDFLELAHKFYGKGNKKRLAVLVKGILPEDRVFNYMKLNSISELRKMSTYTTRKEAMETPKNK